MCRLVLRPHKNTENPSAPVLTSLSFLYKFGAPKHPAAADRRMILKFPIPGIFQISKYLVWERRLPRTPTVLVFF